MMLNLIELILIAMAKIQNFIISDVTSCITFGNNLI
jgi:hypothetical protein